MKTYSYLEVSGQPHAPTVLLLVEAPWCPLHIWRLGGTQSLSGCPGGGGIPLSLQDTNNGSSGPCTIYCTGFAIPGPPVEPAYNHVKCCSTVVKSFFLDKKRRLAIEAASTHVHSVLTMSYQPFVESVVRTKPLAYSGNSLVAWKQSTVLTGWRGMGSLCSLCLLPSGQYCLYRPVFRAGYSELATGWTT
jgi:hypothetical protein